MKKYLKNIELIQKEKIMTEEFNNKLNIIKKQKNNLNKKQNNFNIKNFIILEWKKLEENYFKYEIETKTYLKNINDEILNEYEDINSKKINYDFILFNQIKVLKDLLEKIKSNNISLNDLKEDIKIGTLFKEIFSFFEKGYTSLEYEYNRHKSENNVYIKNILNYNLEETNLNNYSVQKEINKKLDIDEFIWDEVNCESLIEEYNFIILKLEEKITLELEDISLSKKEVFEKLDNINYDKNILKSFLYFKSLLRNKKLEDVFKIFNLIYKNVKRKDLLIYNTFSEEIKFLNRNKASLIKIYLKELDFIKNKIESKILDIYEQLEKKEKINKEKIKLKMKKDILNHKKTEHKFLTNIKKRELENIKELENQIKIKEEEKLEKLYNDHCKEIKILANKYKEFKNKENIKNKEIEINKLEIEKNKIKDEINKNKTNIKIREEKFINNKVKKLEKIKVKKNKINNEKERIWNLVENYKNKPKVDRDSNRLIQNTKSIYNKLNAVNIKDKLFVNHGYKTDDLLNDFKFKLQTYLYESNLINTNYAKNLLNNFVKPNNN